MITSYADAIVSLILGIGAFHSLNRCRRSGIGGLQGFELVHGLLPCLRIFLCCHSIGIAVEAQNVLPQLGGELLEMVVAQLVQQASVGFIRQGVLAGICHLAGVEISVG